MIQNFVKILLLALLASGCSHPFYTSELHPKVTYTPSEHLIARRPSAFPPLTAEEKGEPWSSEIILGDAFARQLDLYRAITCYKRALILIPENRIERRLQITYDIILAYSLGQKYNDVIITFESSQLTEVNPLFPAFSNLLLILYDAYQQVGQCDKAENLSEVIQRASPETGADLTLYEQLKTGDLEQAKPLIATREDHEKLERYIADYEAMALSPSRARLLNAVLPGAGYYYVGQKKAAVTSFMINALFSFAAYQFFDRGYIAAGAITTSLELGWYLGGINGAGIEAQEYNNSIYNRMTIKLLSTQKFFPLLMCETSF